MYFLFCYRETIHPWLPDVPSQIQTLLSLLQVASKFPDGAQATHLTSFSWPSSTVRDWKHTWRTCQSDVTSFNYLRVWKQTSKSSLVFFQMHVVASKLADARYFPQGDQATFLTVRWCPSASTLLHSQLSPENKEQTHNSQTIQIKLD